MVAASSEVVDGVKPTVNEVEFPAAIDDAGKLVTAKSDAFVPLILIVPIES